MSRRGFDNCTIQLSFCKISPVSRGGRGYIHHMGPSLCLNVIKSSVARVIGVTNIWTFKILMAAILVPFGNWGVVIRDKETQRKST